MVGGGEKSSYIQKRKARANLVRYMVHSGICHREEFVFG